MNALTAAKWIDALETPTGAWAAALTDLYGPNYADRLPLLRAALRKFASRFGEDRPVRVFRSPGRINLRGMHVDTHGGYLNLMTHQREMVIVASPADGPLCRFANVNPQFAEQIFSLDDARNDPAFGADWFSFITAAAPATLAHNTGWGRYLRGAMFSALFRFPGEPLQGMDAVVGSDIPRGAALSSSAALCIAGLLALLGLNDRSLSADRLILAARDAEWFTGSRCGLSDQAAEVLCGRNEVVNMAMRGETPEGLDLSGVRRVPWPENLRVLVINSFTERCISGAAQVDYTRNRFAYSLAMEIVRQELAAQGVDADTIAGVRGLPDLPNVPGITLTQLLRRIPERIPVEDLKQRYNLPDLDQTYDRYFGPVAKDLRPREINLRGPLTFGVAESERARVFPEALETGDGLRAGRLMSAGHDGDRRVRPDGRPYFCDVSDAALSAIDAAATTIEMIPGAYGASGPVLDALVDIAMDSGALGASLTGAGIAGVVLALCRTDQAERVAELIRMRMSGKEYAALANRPAPLNYAETRDAVLINEPPRCACEIQPS